MDEYQRHFHKKIPRLDTLKFFLKKLDHLRAGLITSEPLLAAAMKAQPFVGGGSKAGPWGLTIRPSAFTAADTKIAVQTRWNADVRFAPTREIHQHEGCVRFVPKKRQRGVSSPNLCICCVTSSVSVDHINPAGVKGIGELGNVGTDAVTCNAIFDATHVHGGACRMPAFLARTTGISAQLPTPGLFSAAQ
jgi:hypothetical protein